MTIRTVAPSGASAFVRIRPFLVHIVAVALFLWCIAQFYDPRTGFTVFIRFGDSFEARTIPAVGAIPRHVLPDSVGYDGEFYAQMAVDPLLRDPAIDLALDDAALRARRILFSWTAFVAGLAHPPWILQAYALQNVVCWLILSVLLLRWFPPVNARMTTLWVATLFSGGLVWSVIYALLDGPSLLLIALGIAALEGGRRWVSAAIFGVAGLGRETNLLAAVAQADPGARSWRSLLRQAGQLALIVLPLAVWFDYIYSIYRDRIFTSGGTLMVPFSTFLWRWKVALTDVARHGSVDGWYTMLALAAISVQVLFIVIRPAWKDPWWRLGLAYALLMPFFGRPLWEGTPGTAMRVLLPLALAFNVRLRHVESRAAFWTLLVAGNLTIMQGMDMLRMPVVTSWRY